jgi:hypothetical protein
MSIVPLPTWARLSTPSPSPRSPAEHNLDLGTTRRPVAPAVCRHGDVPLPLRAADAGHGLAAGHHGERLRDDGQGHLEGHDPLLGQALRHQLRAGRHHRHHAGVPVRHQLGLLLALRGRHLRRPAGHRRLDGLLPGEHLHRPVLLRLGPADKDPAPDGDHADGGGDQPQRAVDPDRQRLDAEPGGRRVQLPDHAHGDDGLLGGGVQPRRAGQVRAHRVGWAT